MRSTKLIAIVIVTVLVGFGLVVGGPLVAVPLLAVLAVLAYRARRHNQSIATEAAEWGRHWYLWLAVAAIMFLVGSAMLFTANDGELSTAAWATFILSWLAAAIVAAIGLSLGATRLINHRRSHVSSTAN